MNKPHQQNTSQNRSSDPVRDKVLLTESAEDIRSRILRSRAISESEARLAAAPRGLELHDGPAAPSQSQEDAFALPSAEVGRQAGNKDRSST